MGAGEVMLRRLAADQRGVAAIEFAIVGPILVLFLVLVLDASIYSWKLSTLKHAVFAAARCGAISGPSCGTSSAVQQYSAAQAVGLNAAASAFTVGTQSCGYAVSGTVTYQSVLGTFSPFGGNMTASACY